MSSPLRVLSLVVLCSSSVAFTQELGLDLSDAADYRPTAALVGISVVDPKLPKDTGEKLKVDQAASIAVSALEKSQQFSSVLPPGDVFGHISEEYVEALGCAEPKCLASLAEKIDVNQLFIGQLIDKGAKPTLRLISYTRYLETFAQTELEPGKTPKDFEKAVAAGLEAAAAKVTVQLGQLELASSTTGARAFLGKQPLGAVPFKKLVPAGHYTIRVEADGYMADEIDLELGAASNKQLESNLVPKTAEVEQVVDPPPSINETFDEVPAGKPLWKRPGLYVAAGGAAVAGLGLVLGSAAKGIEARAIDTNSDGVLDVTRAEASAARTWALLANVLVGVGAASLGGGVVWALLPAPAQGGGAGFAVAAEGSF